MNWRQFIRDYLIFTKKERAGLFSILLIIAIIIFLPLLFTINSKPVTLKENDILKNVIDSFQSVAINTSTVGEGFEPPVLEMSVSGGYENYSLFTFDPNTLTVEGWKKLGLKERTIKTIQNYVTKGGRFYKPEDLKKIWGLDIIFYERVKDYIVIPQKEKPIFQTAYNNLKPEKKFLVVNINTADTTSLIALPGIGPKLSSRIIAFREKLGGFYSIDQIAETYGLPDSTFQKIKKHLVADPDHIKKININTATKEQIRSHPYFDWNLANAIVEYRNQHGMYKSIDEVKKIILITETTFHKIFHYLTH
ncbi:MAG: helix-hairpin-helix domain-containing protein [Flavisolibacter sp.]|nr:helix-hairpin-helix domain-containing protein [Flavisolibacter sp.]